MELKPTSALEAGADEASNGVKVLCEACGEGITEGNNASREYYSCAVDGEAYHRDCVPVTKENMLFITCGRDIKYGKVTPE